MMRVHQIDHFYAEDTGYIEAYKCGSELTFMNSSRKPWQIAHETGQPDDLEEEVIALEVQTDLGFVLWSYRLVNQGEIVEDVKVE